MNTTTQQNKQLMQAIFAELAQGNGRPFTAAMADDFSWTVTGHGPWARTWRGREAVQRELLAPLFAQFAGTYRNRALRILAEGDIVVVECRGSVATRAGRRYDNHYCYVCRLADGQLKELTEYMDTELATAALGAP